MFFHSNIAGQLYCQTRLQQLSYIAVDAENYSVLETPSLFHKRMLQLIATAKRRIMMTVLYLQDDDCGREILNALYEAKSHNPHLYVKIYVDFHRAQRGLIGKEPSLGNSELYYKAAEHSDNPPSIYGVPVKRRELFGVMHLKGCVFDNTVLYSGASINDVYLDFHGRYRLDRYHEICSEKLADSMCNFVNEAFHTNYAVQDFSQGPVKTAKQIRDDIRTLTRHLTQTQYLFKGDHLHKNQIGICPIAGLGKRRNTLNRAILWMIGAAKNHLFICTPYFNPPKQVQLQLEAALHSGVKITLLVGDKTANDFFIKSDEKFSTVGVVPYIYEQNLRAFMQKHQKSINNGQLEIMLWKNGDNTFHVKGMFTDQNYALITGNNLNPRAWGLDLENGLLISDPSHLLQEKFIHEQLYLLKHTKKISSVSELESPEHYPEEVQKILSKVKMFKASVIIRHLL